ncbi:MAG: hypothetical protein V2J26_09120 [Pacificimonas sp.]|jgi:hypothetical protein|nr:hypothetical protein [Pacificimonas sp.]
MTETGHRLIIGAAAGLAAALVFGAPASGLTDASSVSVPSSARIVQDAASLDISESIGEDLGVQVVVTLDNVDQTVLASNLVRRAGGAGGAVGFDRTLVDEAAAARIERGDIDDTGGSPSTGVTGEDAVEDGKTRRKNDDEEDGVSLSLAGGGIGGFGNAPLTIIAQFN